MKHLIISIFGLFLLCLLSCNQLKEPHVKLQILDHVYYEHLSSASGVMVIDNKTFLIGDDIPWLVEINDDFTIGNKTLLSGIDSIVNGRTPYHLKADYECMETFREDGFDNILVLSSGSKVNSRDTAVLVSFNNEAIILKRNIRPLYEQIKKEAKMADEEINIEGLAVTEEKVYLFHRGNVSGNFIATLPKGDFLHYIKTGHYHQPEIAIYTFDLPKLNGVQSGFSGAYYHDEQQILLFTASMEATNSVTADGEVSGSYIGFIPIDEIEQGTFYAELLEKDDKTLAKKLEGISIKKADGNTLKILSVCDNDDGSSDLFSIKMSINK